jgi:hypothetical protein
MRERSFFFCLGQTSHTHLSFAKPKRKRGWILACGSCLCYRIFGGAAASSLGAVAFGATAGFLRTGAAFGCAAARLLRAGFDDAFKGALDLLVEGARRAADAAADVVALLLLLLLLDDPSAAVSGALSFRRCVGLPSSSLPLELPSSEDEDRLSIVFFGCLSLLFFGLLCHNAVGALKILTRRKENPL